MGKLMIKGKPASGSFDNANNIKYNDTETVADVIETIRSHIGMVIHSTTLDTMEKVIAIYGGTTWEKIEGRMLLGQSDSHAINTTGGNESVSYTPSGSVANHTLTLNQIPSHSHSIPSDQYCGEGAGTDRRYALYDWQSYGRSSGSAGGGQGHNHGWTGTKATIATMPPYKTVYIWERTA